MKTPLLISTLLLALPVALGGCDTPDPCHVRPTSIATDAQGNLTCVENDGEPCDDDPCDAEKDGKLKGPKVNKPGRKL